MSELVIWLKKQAAHLRGLDSSSGDAVRLELAADEIERLQKVIDDANDLARMRRWPLVQCVLEKAGSLVSMSPNQSRNETGNDGKQDRQE